jgi:tetratricopeptide (TPR) repeat protein
MGRLRFRLGFGFICAVALARSDDELSKAYQALAVSHYDDAIVLFRSGLEKQPGNAEAHKDLAYTLLKTGENAEARDEFEKAIHLNTGDETAALEYAFLCYDTKMPIEARRMFDRLRHRGSAQTRATAERAFRNIDQPLETGIQRWRQALAKTANSKDVSTYSARWELAQLAEQRDELPLAAEQYEICWQIKPAVRELLLDLARVWQQLNRVEEARAALLAASRGNEARTAERALEHLDARYPYPYEFLQALKLDPQNVPLRRELAYLYLAMHKEPEAIEQFEHVLAIAPDDRLAKDQLEAARGLKKRSEAAPAPDSSAAANARAMGLKSLAAGYVRDAIRYLRQAHEQDPEDAQVMLKLGWAYNMARQDDDAIYWFDRARRSDDPAIAQEAGKAWHNLESAGQPSLTIWALPMYSSRWKDAFTYGQIKWTIPLPWRKANTIFSLYVSTRFIGDARSGLPTPSGVAPQYFSENSFIFGAGVSSRVWHHLTAWAEAGEAVTYLPGRTDVGAAIPDYRGGLNFAKGYGQLLGSKKSGLFYETTGDAIYVSRFQKDWLFYSQHRAGRTFRFGTGTDAQVLFNVNYTRDSKNQYWANTVEVGPGIRARLPWMPPNVYFAVDVLRGIYTNNDFNPRRPNYNDIRVSLWYAVSK